MSIMILYLLKVYLLNLLIEYPYDFCSETIFCDYICKMLDEGEYCFALWNETIITNYLYEKQNPGILRAWMLRIRL